jgi:hypothetical protein
MQKTPEKNNNNNDPPELKKQILQSGIYSLATRMITNQDFKS